MSAALIRPGTAKQTPARPPSSQSTNQLDQSITLRSEGVVMMEMEELRHRLEMAEKRISLLKKKQSENSDEPNPPRSHLYHFDPEMLVIGASFTATHESQTLDTEILPALTPAQPVASLLAPKPLKSQQSQTDPATIITQQVQLSDAVCFTESTEWEFLEKGTDTEPERTSNPVTKVLASHECQTDIVESVSPVEAQPESSQRGVLITTAEFGGDPIPLSKSPLRMGRTEEVSTETVATESVDAATEVSIAVDVPLMVVNSTEKTTDVFRMVDKVDQSSSTHEMNFKKETSDSGMDPIQSLNATTDTFTNTEQTTTTVDMGTLTNPLVGPVSVVVNVSETIRSTELVESGTQHTTSSTVDDNDDAHEEEQQETIENLKAQLAAAHSSESDLNQIIEDLQVQLEQERKNHTVTRQTLEACEIASAGLQEEINSLSDESKLLSYKFTECSTLLTVANAELKKRAAIVSVEFETQTNADQESNLMDLKLVTASLQQQLAIALEQISGLSTKIEEREQSVESQPHLNVSGVDMIETQALAELHARISSLEEELEDSREQSLLMSQSLSSIRERTAAAISDGISVEPTFDDPFGEEVSGADISARSPSFDGDEGPLDLADLPGIDPLSDSNPLSVPVSSVTEIDADAHTQLSRVLLLASEQTVKRLSCQLEASLIALGTIQLQLEATVQSQAAVMSTEKQELQQSIAELRHELRVAFDAKEDDERHIEELNRSIRIETDALNLEAVGSEAVIAQLEEEKRTLDERVLEVEQQASKNQDVIAELRNQCSDLDACIAQLTLANEELRETLTAEKSNTLLQQEQILELSAHVADYEPLKNSLALLQKKYSQLEAEAETSWQEAVRSSNKLEDTSTSLTQISMERDGLRSEVVAKEALLLSVTEETSMIYLELKDTKVLLNEYELELFDARSRVVGLTEANSKLTRENAALSGSHEQLVELKGSFAGLKEQYEFASVSLASVQKQLELTTQDLNVALVELSRLSSKSAQDDVQIAKLRQECEDSWLESVNTSNRLADYEETVRLNKNEMQVMQQRMDVIMSQQSTETADLELIATLRAQVDELTNSTKERETRIQILQAEAVSNIGRMNSAQAQRATLLMQLNHSSEQITSLQDQCVNLEQLLAAMQGDNKRERVQMENTAAKLMEDADNLRSENRKLVDFVTNLKDRLQSKDTDFQVSEKSRIFITSQLRESEEKRNRIKSKHSRAMKEVRSFMETQQTERIAQSEQLSAAQSALVRSEQMIQEEHQLRVEIVARLEKQIGLLEGQLRRTLEEKQNLEVKYAQFGHVEQERDQWKQECERCSNEILRLNTVLEQSAESERLAHASAAEAMEELQNAQHTILQEQSQFEQQQTVNHRHQQQRYFEERPVPSLIDLPTPDSNQPGSAEIPLRSPILPSPPFTMPEEMSQLLQNSTVEPVREDAPFSSVKIDARDDTTHVRSRLAFLLDGLNNTLTAMKSRSGAESVAAAAVLESLMSVLQAEMLAVVEPPSNKDIPSPIPHKRYIFPDVRSPRLTRPMSAVQRPSSASAKRHLQQHPPNNKSDKPKKTSTPLRSTSPHLYAAKKAIDPHSHDRSLSPNRCFACPPTPPTVSSPDMKSPLHARRMKRAAWGNPSSPSSQVPHQHK